MIRALLSVLLCSTFCTLALSQTGLPLFSANFDETGGCQVGETNLPGFEVDSASPTDMKCDNTVFRSSHWSAKIMSDDPGEITYDAYMGNEITVQPGVPLSLSFWLRTGDGLAYPTTYWLSGTWVRRSAIPLPSPLHGDYPIGLPTLFGFSKTIDEGLWHKYTAVFTPTAPGGVNQATFYFRIEWARLALVTSRRDIWVDDFICDYATPLIVGDPQFVGLRGQSYQVHGIDGAVYNLVSSPSTQVNSRFVFLDDGKCPIFDGIPAKNCWAHAGSYLGAIGVQQIVDDVTHKLAITSGSSTDGFSSVILDGKALSINDTRAYGDYFDVIYVSSHVVMVNTADFAFTFENSDMFINQGVAANKPLSQLSSHGLFGQTHKMAVYPSPIKYIAGDIDDYVVNDNDLFGEEFVYNQFHATH